MKNPSLQFRLSVNILAVLLSVIFIITGFIIYRANTASDRINEKTLETRQDQLIKSIIKDKDNRLSLKIPDKLKRLFSSSHDNIFIIKSYTGGDIWLSHPELRSFAKSWLIDEDDGKFVSLDDVFTDRGTFYGLSRKYETENGKFMALVAQSGNQREFAGYVLSEFLEDIAWASPLFILLVIGTVVVTIRLSLNILAEISDKATAINPRTMNLRLAAGGLPQEIVPLVEAVNRTLDRLETGFSAERRFTANAAHELRTPLSILRARIDNLETAAPASEVLKELKHDIERMARVISQLLTAAGIEMPRSEHRIVVVNDVIKDAVSALAPLAVEKQQELSLRLPQQPLKLNGDYGQLYEAIRNLVENAIQYCPSGSGIEVSLDQSGTVRVLDNGPGIPAADKERIFERFYRGTQVKSSSNGAGLGLSIVRDIALRYGGGITVEDTPGGGATFLLALPLDPA